MTNAAASTRSKPGAEPPHDEKAPPQSFTKAEELDAYRRMLLIRRFEEKAGQLYGMGLIGGFCHLYIGQEAVVVGVMMAAKPGDQTITGYRDHGHMLACGMDPKGVMAELTGRRGGFSKGKGGSMHMFSQGEAFLRRPRHRRRAGAARHRARLRQPLPRQWPRRPTPISATAPPTRGRSTRASTWLSYGSCRWSTWSRTIDTPWAPRSSAPRRSAISPSAARASTFRANRSTAWTCARSRRRANARANGAATAMGRSSWKCKPTATAAIRCPIRRNTAQKKKCRKDARGA